MIRKLTSIVLLFDIALMLTGIPVYCGIEESAAALLLEEGAPTDNEVYAAAESILAQLVAANKIEEDNNFLENLKSQTLTNADKKIIVAIDNGLQGTIVPQIFKIDELVAAKQPSRFSLAQVGLQAAGIIMIVAGVLVLFSLYPTGLAMGISENEVCDSTALLTSTSKLCINGTGYIIEGNLNGQAFYCPEGFSKVIGLNSGDVCLENGNYSLVTTVHEYSGKTLGKVLGSIAGSGVSCCFCGIISLISGCVCSICGENKEEKAQKATNQEIAASNLSDKFPQLEAAVKLLIKRKTK